MSYGVIIIKLKFSLYWFYKLCKEQRFYLFIYLLMLYSTSAEGL